jgi:hypothetical protein
MPAVKHHKRPILAQLHRGKELVWSRYYVKISTAIPRAVGLAILEGQPGDVVEFSNSNFGFLIATCKLSVTGKLSIEIHKDLIAAEDR